MSFLGLDVGSRVSHWCVTENGETFTQGTTNLAKFPELLTAHNVQFIACEYTGRLAEQWSLAAEEHGAKAYILHSTTRKALSTLGRQSVKTDKRDAEALCALLYVWADKTRRDLVRLSGDLLIDAATVRTAWQLRSLLSSVDTLTTLRTSAKLRMISAARVGNAHMAEIWRETADGNAPERALMQGMAYARAEFPAQYDLLLSIPGIADRAATYLLAALMPIERFTEIRKRGGRDHDDGPRNIKRYAGLYPRVVQSGKMSQAEYLSNRGSPRLRGMLYICAMGQINRKNLFSASYVRHVERGLPKKKALILVCCQMLRVVYAVLKQGTPFVDPTAPPPPEARPVHLVTQADAARALGLTRQMVSLMVKNDKLRAETWNGKTYVVAKYLELEVERRAQKEASK